MVELKVLYSMLGTRLTTLRDTILMQSLLKTLHFNKLVVDRWSQGWGTRAQGMWSAVMRWLCVERVIRGIIS